MSVSSVVRNLTRSFFCSAPQRLAFSLPYAQQLADIENGECGQDTDSLLTCPSEMVGSEVPTNISAKSLRIYFNGCSPLLPYLIELPQGRVYAWQATVCDSKGDILMDVSDALTPKGCRWNTQQHSITLKQDLPFPRKQHGELVVLSSPYANNYFHWLFDTLPRLEAEVCKGERPLFVHQYRAYQRDALELLGIAKGRIVAAEKHPHLRADMLLVPSLPFPPLPAPPSVWRLPVVTSEACAFLRAKLLPSVKARFGSEWDTVLPQKIFIRRKGARSVCNESDVNRVLSDKGFQVVALEELSLGEQIRLFYHVKVVVGVHGAGLANVVFCKPGTRIVELMPSAWAMPCYWSISRHVGLVYKRVNVSSQALPGGDASASSSVHVKLDELLAALVE